MKGVPNQWTYMVMNHAKDGEGSIDNSHMCTTIQINNSPSYPEFTIGIKLAKAMGCVKMGTMEHGEVGYILSPKLRKESPTILYLQLSMSSNPKTMRTRSCTRSIPMY